MQSHAVHQLIHDEGCACHVAGVLHERYEQIEYQDVGQKDDDAPHAADYSVYYQVLEYPLGHRVAYPVAQYPDAVFDPFHRVAADDECRPEHQEHQEQEYRESEQFVGYERIDDLGRSHLLALSGHERLAECTGNEPVLVIGEDGLHILAGDLFYLFDLPVALLGPLRIFRLFLQQLFDFRIPFQKFGGKESGGKVFLYAAVFLQAFFEGLDAVLDLLSVYYVYVLWLYPVLVQLDHSVKKFLDTSPRTRNRRDDRYAEQFAQHLVVEGGTAVFQFVVHIQCHHRGAVHVDEVSGEVEVPFEVGCRNDVYHYVGCLLGQVSANELLFGRVGRKRVCAR